MLNADKELLLSNLKQNALSLREKELNFFNDNFAAVGTQAALIAGFSMTALAELTVPETTSRFFKASFYLCTVITLACELHCVCTTTFICVWGPGLALRGPDGSIHRAVDGMMEERYQVFFSFGAGIISFILAAIAACWILMDPDTATIGSLILVGGLCLIWRYGRRIHQRFRIKDGDVVDFEALDKMHMR
eukprot:TRINITY_DN16015_c0_g1_i1.p1 TRINITY_DN16015_c0_g1~~TRINITY_DN16015_c0_g1_i1.p1  ORF type:complete len:191 (-),score=45.16 TRINITY_DN16015_c0_g1_i1:214-786(-)